MRVLVNSLPKSGTHLLSRFCDLIGLKKSEFHLSGSLLRATSKYYVKNWYKLRRLSQDGIEIDLDRPENKIRSDWLRNKLNSIPQMTYFLGHAPYSPELIELLTEENIAVLHISREPKDVLISLCNHFTKFDNYPFYNDFVELSSIKERILLCINGIERDNNKLAPFKFRIQRAEGWRRDTRVCTIAFEEMIGPKGGGSIKAQKLAVSKLLRKINMSDLDLDYIGQRLFYNRSKTFNKGTIGQWKHILNDELLAYYKMHVE